MALQQNLGNVVGLIKSPTEPEKKYVIWSHVLNPANPDRFVNKYYDTDLKIWVPLTEGNPYYQKPVIGVNVTDPPSSPVIGDRYIIGDLPSGSWSGFGHFIGQWWGNMWQFTPPLTNMVTSNVNEPGSLYLFTGNVWEAFSPGESAVFDGERPITRNIPGLYGVVIGGKTVSEFNERLYFPLLPPGASLSISGPGTREMGAPANVTLLFTATKTSTRSITGIKIGNTAITPVLGTTQSGSFDTVGNPNADKEFTLTVTDGTHTTTDTKTLYYRHKRFYFVSNQNLLAMTDEDLSAFFRALSLTQSGEWEYSTNRVYPMRTYKPRAQYIYFAYVDEWNNNPTPTLPTFTMNGTPSTDWLNKLFTFKNNENFTAQFRIFRSGNVLDSDFLVDVK